MPTVDNFHHYKWQKEVPWVIHRVCVFHIKMYSVHILILCKNMYVGVSWARNHSSIHGAIVSYSSSQTSCSEWPASFFLVDKYGTVWRHICEFNQRLLWTKCVTKLYWAGTKFSILDLKSSVMIKAQRGEYLNINPKWMRTYFMWNLRILEINFQR